MLKFYSNFEICDETGDSLTENQMILRHYEKVTSLQVIFFLIFFGSNIFN